MRDRHEQTHRQICSGDTQLLADSHREQVVSEEMKDKPAVQMTKHQGRGGWK